MDELTFVVEQLPAGLIARAVGIDLVVAAATDAELRERIEEAVYERFPEGEGPSRIRLHRRAPGHPPRPPHGPRPLPIVELRKPPDT